jgi:hypothetical protein
MASPVPTGEADSPKKPSPEDAVAIGAVGPETVCPARSCAC